MDGIWQDEWPEEPGRWWFYGKPSSHADKARLMAVRVWENGAVISEDGGFLYRDPMKGVWAEAFPPPPPGRKTT